MSEPLDKSCHLDFPRREDFRICREQLVQNLREQTLHTKRVQPPTGLWKGDAPPPKAPPGNEPIWQTCPFGLVQGEHFISLHVGVTVLGRSPKCDIVLKPNYISRTHCAILIGNDGHCELHDLASRNGTYLNNVHLNKPTTLRSGDRIRLCDQCFVFRLCSGTPLLEPPDCKDNSDPETEFLLG